MENQWSKKMKFKYYVESIKIWYKMMYGNLMKILMISLKLVIIYFLQRERVLE